LNVLDPPFLKALLFSSKEGALRHPRGAPTLVGAPWVCSAQEGTLGARLLKLARPSGGGALLCGAKPSFVCIKLFTFFLYFTRRKGPSPSEAPPLTNRPNSLYYNELGRFVRGGSCFANGRERNSDLFLQSMSPPLLTIYFIYNLFSKL